MKGTLKNPVNAMKRAMRSMSRDGSRLILCAAHLDECGDVVATDGYRLSVEHGAWEGPSIDIDHATAYDIAHHKGRCESAVIEVHGTAATVTMDDGTVIEGSIREGRYPNYSQFMQGDYCTGITFRTKELLKVTRELVKAKSDALISTDGEHAVVSSALGKCETYERFEHCAVGAAMEIRFNSTYMRDALNSISGEMVEIRMTSPIKPAIFAEGDLSVSSKVGFRSFETLVMPVRNDCGKPKPKARAPKEFDRELVVSGLLHLANERAMNDPDCKFIGERASEDERRLVWALQKDGRLVHEKSSATYTSDYYTWKLDGEFLCCIEERWSKRKVKLHYPALKPVLHREDKASEKEESMATKNEESKMNESINLNGERVCITGTLPGMTRNEAFIRLKAVGGEPCERFTKKVTLMVVASSAGKSKRDKLDKAIENGQKVRVIDGHEFLEALKKAEAEQTAKAIEQAAKRRKAEVEAKVTEHADVKAVEMTPKKKEDNMIDEMRKQLEEMQAELKATRKELDSVWKENAQLKAKKQEPKSVPPAPKAPKSEDAAAVVSLATMQKWCEGKGLIASQKREGTCIWVEGDSKAYKDELVEMGFRFAKKRKSWYLNPAA